MINAKIDLSDLISKINSLSTPELVRDVAKAIAEEAAEPELAKEPFRSPPYKKQPFKSAKQRAFFFAAVKSGDLEVPYRRTGKIGEVEKRPTANGMDVVATADHSDLVRTKDKQANYHKGLWPTDEDIATKIEGDIAELIGVAHVIATLEKAGLT